MSNLFAPVLFSAYDADVILGDMSLGQRIKEARQAAGLTQLELADRVGVTMQAVSSWENAVAQGIRADTLFKVADALRVSARWLATGESGAGMGQTAFAELASDMADLSIEQQQAVLAIVKTMKGP